MEIAEIKYWSNSLGELHTPYGRDIIPDELPKALRRADRDLYTDSFGSLCYLVEYHGKYGVAMINEFDYDYVLNSGTTMDALYAHMWKLKEMYQSMEEFRTADIILGQNSGFDGCHELAVIFPADTDAELFQKASRILDETVYRL